ncbi:MAG: hypothetical protein IJE46_05940 [Clostridia bacterium]|nr:hypothetical protein [Clostridia bacterium]
MKKAWKIVLGIFVVLILLIAILLVWQWENITALYTGITSSDVQIEHKIEENKQKFTEILEKEELFDKKVIDGFSKEEEEKIASGEITVEEAVNKLFEEEPKEPPLEPEQEQENISDESDQSVEIQPEIDETDEKQKQLMQTAIKEMYTLKAEFTKKLAEIEKIGKKMYYDGYVGQYSIENKLKVADHLMSQLVEAEKECDTKVDQVLKTLYDGLTEINKDTEVVDLIRDQYKKEKQLKKTQYIKDFL